jgi:hypothetical protein
VKSLSLLAVVLSLVLLTGCSTPNEKLLYGTFTKDSGEFQKMVRAVGSFKDYALPSDETPAQEATEKIVKAWNDSEGNTWFQTYATFTSGPHKSMTPKLEILSRISRDGKVLELMWNGGTEFNPKGFPTKIDPSDTLRYRMYNRVGDLLTTKVSHPVWGTFAN